MLLRLKAYQTGCRGLRYLFHWKALIVLIGSAALTAGALVQVHALTISAVKKDTIVLVRRININDRFAYHAIHSVELSAVEEYFRIGADYRITLYETSFHSSNVGLPYAAFGEEVFIREQDGYRITNMSRHIPELLIWANERYDNTLSMGAESWPLYTFAGNTLLRIGIDSLSLLKFIFLRAFS